jgi:hypothetical protein
MTDRRYSRAMIELERAFRWHRFIGFAWGLLVGAVAVFILFYPF